MVSAIQVYQHVRIKKMNLCNLVFNHCLVVIYRNVSQVLYTQHLECTQKQQSDNFEDLPKMLVTCKLFEVNRPWYDFTQVDPVAETGPEDLPEEHLPEALKLKSG